MEAKPFRNLKELYDSINNLESWPPIKKLRDSADYVYLGSEVNAQFGSEVNAQFGSEVNAKKTKLQKFDRDEKPRTLVCHDMKGGYLEDRFIEGSKSYNSYLFYHWSVIDTFVYFSHHFVTIPPYGWINAAHDHGVKVLGTIITEREGIWDPILESQDEVKKFANALIAVAKFYEFDGWLLNVENVIKVEQVTNLLYFVEYLTKSIHEAIENSEIIWYDSVIKDGTLHWQNELNAKNVDFFLNCDGIYLNYNWRKYKLDESRKLAKKHKRNIHDIYVGIDVWGRGCPGGGGFNSSHALEKIRKEGLSVAIFAPGWTHEYFGPETFQELEDIFWAQLFPHLFVHVLICEGEVFKTSFCRGSGSSYYHCGELQLEERVVDNKNIFEEKPFYNLSAQNPQLSVSIPHLQFTRAPPPPKPKSENDRNECAQQSISVVYETRKHIIRTTGNIVNIQDKMSILDVNFFEFCKTFSFEGGGCLKLITNDLNTYHRLFLLHIEFEQDVEATIVYEQLEIFAENKSEVEPILVLGNSSGLSQISHVRSRKEDLHSRWKKCVYVTNMKTVNEIGVSFAGKNVCYLGQIILEQKPQNPNVEHIHNFDGIIGCYSGFIPNVCSHIISTIAYEKTSEYMQFFDAQVFQAIENSDERFYEIHKYAFIREVICQTGRTILSYPIKLIALRTMAQFVGREECYSGLYKSVIEVYKHQGILGFYIGLCPYLLGIIGQLMFETYVEYILGRYLITDYEFITCIIYSMRLIGPSFSEPFFTASNRMAINNCGLIAGKPPQMSIYRNWLDCLLDLPSIQQVGRKYDSFKVETDMFLLQICRRFI